MTDMPPPPPPNMAPPPGYVAYGGAGAALSPQVQRIGGISKWLFGLMCAMVPLQAIGVVTLFGIVDKARDAIGDPSRLDDFEDALNNPMNTLASALFLPSAVLTMIWMYRMAANLRVLGRVGATWAPGWAIGGWFVPPMAVYAVPWLMFRELWKGSDPDVAPFDPDWKRGKVTPLAEIWWVLYGLVPIAGIVTSAATFSNMMERDTLDAAEAYDRFAAINLGLAAVGVVTAAVYAVFVRQLSARHMRATREA